MSSFLPKAGSQVVDVVDVVVAALQPLYKTVPDGEDIVRKHLAGSASAASEARALLLALGAIVEQPDGSLSAGGSSEPAPAKRVATPLIDVPCKVLKSLYTALEKQAKQRQAELAAAGGPPEIGTQCKRKNCKLRYEGEASDEQECSFCPGEPVFHEGFKYWSCCDSKKTLEFDEFLNFPGCDKAQSCQWFEDSAETKAEKPVRMDHFQTGSEFVASFFLKCAEPEKTQIKVNEGTLSISSIYEGGVPFSKTFELAADVTPTKCSAVIGSTKIDVKLVKAHGETWPGLEKPALE